MLVYPMYTKIYEVDHDTAVQLPTFGEKGRVIVVFAPEWEQLYRESEEYMQDSIVFTGTADEAIDSLRNLHQSIDVD